MARGQRVRTAGLYTAGILATLVLAGQNQTAALAEPPTQGSTVSIAPTATGPTTSQGSAGYDSSGIDAQASNPGVQTSTTSSSQSQPSYTVQAPTPLLVATAPSTQQGGCASGQPTYFSYQGTALDAASQPLILSGGTPGVPCPANQAPPPPTPQTPTAVQLAEEASSKQPWPNLVIGVNPGTGLTGLGSWFWLGGGSPKMPDAIASASGLTVSVRATLVDVIWEFGDGSGYDSGTDTGQAYPAQSDIEHVYQGDTYQMPQGYTLTVTLRYRVDYSVSGGPWTELGIKGKSYSRSYSVNQLQPQAVSAQ